MSAGTLQETEVGAGALSLRMTRAVKVGMYLLSLWLLFVLILVNKLSIEICLNCRFARGAEWIAIVVTNALPIVCLTLLTASLVLYSRFKSLVGGAKEGPFVIDELEDKSSEHLVFLATYVIPLVGFGLDSLRQIINLIITLVILGAIYVKTDLFYANPTLSLLGFKIFSVKIQNKSVVLIAREDLRSGDSVNTLRLDQKILFAKKAISVNENT